jgi:FMN phosphatase YigB (HAD superfamily)
MVQAGGLLSCPKAVLLDVGGTLWPDRTSLIPDREGLLSARLRDAHPALTDQLVDRLAAEIDAGLSVLDGERLVQETDAVVDECARRCGLSWTASEIATARRAFCIPVVGRVDLFPGARELLVAIKAYQLRLVVVSNTITRDSVVYSEDFQGFGVRKYVDTIISSADVGFRKPHPAMFQAALNAAGCGPEACVMVGNSEAKDIVPAMRLGMRTIRVCIEEPVPAASAADAVLASLSEVEATLRDWCG